MELSDRQTRPKNQIHTEAFNPFSTEKTMQKGSKVTKGITLKKEIKERHKTPLTISFFDIGKINKGLTSVTGMD